MKLLSAALRPAPGFAVTFASAALAALALLTGCTPRSAEAPHSFAYVTNSGSNRVSVIDLGTLKVTASLATGNNPTGVTASPARDEVYVVNTDSATVTVIDATTNRIAGNIPVGRQPYYISVTEDGKRGWVANPAATRSPRLILNRTACWPPSPWDVSPASHASRPMATSSPSPITRTTR